MTERGAGSATLSDRLVARATGALARTDRRGFLGRAALVGTALATNPLRYILRPGTAYAAVCGCAGQSCSCGSTCCDGYTEFCCRLNGINRCPPGTIVGGWWKADGSGFCDAGSTPKPRYYLDCNASCGGCGCGSSGICASSCASCSCRCAQGSCANRKTCCTRFRYGQCNQHIACIGPIVCRVVTCTPPWRWEPSCTHTVAVDNNTRFHNRPCLQPAALPAVRRGSTWILGRELMKGADTFSFAFGQADDLPVFGDWDGGGRSTVGVFREGRWLLSLKNWSGAAHLDFRFGAAGDIPVVGDWDGNGKDSIGVVRPMGPPADPLDVVFGQPSPGTLRWLLRNRNSSGPATFDFEYGQPGDIPVVGDWNGDGKTGIGVVRGNEWRLRSSPSGGPPDIVFQLGKAGDVPIVGDWTNKGLVRPGVVRGNQWLLRTKLSGGSPQLTLTFGTEDDTPLVWHA